MIRAEHLNKYYNRNKSNRLQVLNDVSLDLPERGLVALFGKSGCGKTTLLNVLGGLDYAQEGSVAYGDEKLTKRNVDRLRNRYVGYIFQNYNLNQGLSVFDNIAEVLDLCGLNDRKEIEERVTIALKNVGMDRYKDRLPATLSGGQQQRVAIARALVKNPDIILADEPTGNLDERNTLAVMEILKTISRQKLVLLVTHEERLVERYCDTIIEMKDGKLLAEHKNSEEDGGNGGQNTSIPINIIRQEGKTCLQCDDPNVVLVQKDADPKTETDESADVLLEGRLRPYTPLPPMPDKRSERQKIHLWKSVKEAYVNQLKGNKFGKKMMISILTIFSFALLICFSFLSAVIEEKKVEEDQFSKQTLYYILKDQNSVDRLVDFAQKNDKVLGCYPEYGNILENNQEGLSLSLGIFDSYLTRLYAPTPAVQDLTALEGKKLIEGRMPNRNAKEVVISKGYADWLMRSNTLSYLDRYEKFYALRMGDYNIVGITDESAVTVYQNRNDMLYDSLYSHINYSVDEYLQKGQVSIQSNGFQITKEEFESLYPLGGTVELDGKSYVIVEIFGQWAKRDQNSPRRDASSDLWHPTDDGHYRQFHLSEEDFFAMQYRVNDDIMSIRLYTNEKSTLQSEIKQTLGFDHYDTRQQLSEELQTKLSTAIIMVSVIIVLMGVSMYFLMRSSFLSRVKEIGVYRAVGANKSTIIIKILIEILVLTTLTGFLAYLVGLGLLYYVSSLKLVSLMFVNVRAWMALAVFGLIYGVSIVCGLLPVLGLLRKSPAQILAKYDI